MDKKKDNPLSSRIDLMITVIVTVFFLLILVFSYGEFEKSILNVFMILCTMIGGVIGFYTNMTIAILYSIAFDFIYASINIYQNIANGSPIGFDVYFWMVAIPLFSMIFAYEGKLIKELQQENNSVKKENDELVMIDKDTKLRGFQTFYDELRSYMNISRRYGIEVYLMLIKLKYDKEIAKVIGNTKYNKLINGISQIIDSALREEDRKYILRELNMFAVIFMSNKDGGKFVEDRLRETIESAEFKEDYVINKIKLEITVGTALYDVDGISNPYDFFRLAEKDMEYDV